MAIEKNGRKYTQDQMDLMEKLKDMGADIKEAKDDIRDIKAKLEADYITRGEMNVMLIKFQALSDKCDFLQKIVYGFIGLVMVTVIGGLVTWYVNAPK